MSLRDRVNQWRSRVAKFQDPHFAECQVGTLKLEKIDTQLVGHFVSIGFESGLRHYVFEGQANRDRFVNQYRPHGAKPSRNPYP